jgi:hypothetical protein
MVHAVIVSVKLSENPDPTVLREQVVPRVKELPGFVAGYWTRDDLTGRSMVVFDSEENARAASDMVPSMVPPGTQIEGNSVAEVVANA